MLLMCVLLEFVCNLVWCDHGTLAAPQLHYCVARAIVSKVA
jgi:hypothetical protein